MSNSLSGLKTFMTSIIGFQPWDLDPLVIRKPWSDEEWKLRDHGGEGAPLCFAIMWDNGLIKPHPPYVRAMKMVKSALENAGHKGELRICPLPRRVYLFSITSDRLGAAQTFRNLL
jgi:amidase